MSSQSEHLPYPEQQAVNTVYWPIIRNNWPDGWPQPPAFGSKAFKEYITDE